MKKVDGSVRLVSSKSLIDAVDGLDGLYDSQARFFLIDYGPDEDTPGRVKFLFWAFQFKKNKLHRYKN